MKWLQNEIAICAACLTTFISCSQLNLNLGSDDDASLGNETFEANEERNNVVLEAPQWNSLEESLEYLEDLREKAPDLLIDRYRDGGRDFIRGVFRQFRDAIAKEATSKVDFAPWRKISSESCLDTNQIDLFGIREVGDLRALLENSYIGRLKPKQAELFNPQLPDKLDEISRLALFEFGVSIQGESTFAQSGEDYTMSADIRWKVIHEQGDDLALWLSDDSGVKFSMIRQYRAGDTDSLVLEALVGPSVYEDEVISALPAFSLKYVKSLKENETSEFQYLELTRGLKNPDGTWQKLFLSRKVELIYNKNDETILELIDTDQWQMPNEQVRRYGLKVSESQICLRQDVNMDDIEPLPEVDVPSDDELEEPVSPNPLPPEEDPDVWDSPDDDASQNQDPSK